MLTWTKRNDAKTSCYSPCTCKSTINLSV